MCSDFDYSSTVFLARDSFPFLPKKGPNTLTHVLSQRLQTQ